MTKISKANIGTGLTFCRKQHAILLDDHLIGRFVQYGKPSRSGLNKTLYGSRIYHGPVKIEVEATTLSALLNKVAAEIANAIAAGNWTVAH